MNDLEQFQATYIGIGVLIHSPNVLPSVDGQVQTHNADGTFREFVTPYVSSGSGSQLLHHGGALSGSSVSGANLTLGGTLSVAGATGGSSFATRVTGATINAGTSLYDVGLRINTYDNENTSDPNYPYGSCSALDIDLHSTWFGGGDALRIFTNEGGVRSKVVYFASSGALYTRVGIVISGSFSNSLTNQGEDTTITHPSNDQSMLAIWSDVIGGIQVRAANVANPWNWEGLDRSGNKTSSIMEDGSYLFGAGATHASMDVGISRASAGVLEINNTALGTYRDLNLRNLSASEEVRAYDGTYYTGLKTTGNKSGLYRGGGLNATFCYYDTTTGDSVLDAVFPGAGIRFDIAGTNKMFLANSGTGATLAVNTGASSNMLLGQWGGSGTYNALSLNGVLTAAGLTGFFSGASGDNNMWANVPTGSSYVWRINNIGIAELTSTLLTIPGGIAMNGDITGAGAMDFTPGLAASKVMIDEWAGSGSYGAMSFNGVLTAAGIVGLFGSATDPNLYINVPTGGALTYRINNSAVGAWNATGLGIGTTISPTGGGTPVLVLGDAISDPTGMPANSAGVYAKAGELWGVDATGNASIQTPHPLDAPPMMYDDVPGREDFQKTIQQYRGRIYWRNASRVAKLAMMTPAQRAALTAAQRVYEFEETFAAYNARTGANLVKQDWDAHQQEQATRRTQEQTKWDEQQAEWLAKMRARAKLPRWLRGSAISPPQNRPPTFTPKPAPAAIGV